MKLVCLNDEDCSNNMKTLLTYICETKNMKQYVYELIKEFAINNNNIYLKSNLLDLMNLLHQSLRGDIFND